MVQRPEVDRGSCEPMPVYSRQAQLTAKTGLEYDARTCACEIF